MDNRDRPRDLPEVALTVGSGWAGDACARRWLHERGEGLRPQRRAETLRYGDAWHAVLEDVYRWWQSRPTSAYLPTYLTACAWCTGSGCAIGVPGGDVPCAHCGGTGRGPVARQADAWAGTDLEGKGETLRRAAEGWLTVRGGSPASGWTVVGVETPLCFPLPSPAARDGQTYAPVLPVVTRPDGTRRLARAGEAVPGRLPEGFRLDHERVPAWGSVRLDAMLRSPGGALWVGEWKSSSDPRGYLEGLIVDPQVTIYELAIEHAIATGALFLPGPGRIGWRWPEPPTAGGWLYDVASSHLQRDPTVLKSGTFSGASSTLASVPSWRLRAALLASGIPGSEEAAPAKEGRRAATWDDRIADAVSFVDPKFYARESGCSPPALRRRVLAEMYATARLRASRIRAASSTVDPDALALAFPRTAICRGPGSRCAFRDPCTSDTAEARRWFDRPSDDRHADAPVELDVDQDSEPTDPEG